MNRRSSILEVAVEGLGFSLLFLSLGWLWLMGRGDTAASNPIVLACIGLAILVAGRTVFQILLPGKRNGDFK